MRNLISAVLYAAALLTSSVLYVSGQTAPATTPVLYPGDVVRITVFRKPELSGDVVIAADGTLRHPLYRDLPVAGLPIADAESRIRERLARYESNPQFVIEPLLRVSVSGQVRQPSLYSLPPETTVAQAVALAGGVTEQGRMDRVRLLRDGQEIRVDLQGARGPAQLPVRSGDQIVVDRRVNVFREYIAPSGSIAAALVALVNLLTR